MSRARRAAVLDFSRWLPAALALLFGLILLPAVASPAAPSDFRIPPYLLQVGRSSGVVAFRLDAPREATLRIFDGDTPPREIRSGAPRTAHFLRVDGLRPGRSYRYEVTCDDGPRTPPGDRSYELRTAGLPGESFSFAVYGDPRPGETGSHHYHRAIVERAREGDPAFVLLLGDLVDDGREAAQWEEFFAIEVPLLRRSAAFPVLGDNDLQSDSRRYRDYFPALEPGYYAFEWSGVWFFGLHAWDTRGLQPRDTFDAESPQTRWLAAQLERPEVRAAPFRVVFLHDPVRIRRGRSSAVLRRALEPVLRRGRVDLVLSSWHLYERSVHEEVVHVVTGGAGAEILWMRPDPEIRSIVEARRHHYCRVDVSAGGMELRAIADDGTVLDVVQLLPRSDERRREGGLKRRALRLSQLRPIGRAPAERSLDAWAFSTNCADCRWLLERRLPALATELGVSLQLRVVDLRRRGAYGLLRVAEADFGREGVAVPALFVGQAALGGRKELGQSLEDELRRFAAAPGAYRASAVRPFEAEQDVDALRERSFSALTFGVVLGAGLLDGVNPCAFTTVVLLLSYLGLVGGRRRTLLRVGGMFTLGVLLAYLAFGLLLFQLTTWLARLEGLTVALQLAMLALVVALAGLSVVDLVRAAQGRAREMALTLPPGLRRVVRERVRHFAREGRGAVAAAFLLGIVVSALELACTGQVYLPIVSFLSDPRHRASAVLYLVVYNLAFILPLAAVFLAAAYGTTSQRLAAVFQRRLVLLKGGFVLLFVGLAALILQQLALRF